VYAGPRLLAVADGMGGMAAGDVASNIVIGTMAPLDEDVPDGALLDALRGVVDSANQQLRDTVDANPAMEGMGTTLTAMLFSGSKIGMVHIGDSRAYVLRDGEFGQITKDDTYVQMLIDEGRISPEEADSHPQRHLLYRALDGRDAEPEYSVREAHAGDRYLLCSDGLSGVVSAETIAATLREYVDPNQCAERLVQLALRGGGPDNITVIVADVTDGDITESVPIVGGAAARDRGMATSADETMAAARASAVTVPRAPAPEHENGASAEDEDDRPRRHPLRALTLTLLLIALLGGGLYGGYFYTQSRYYVGVTDDGTVAVFQGVPGEIAGLHLSSEHKRSTTNVNDLTDVAQDAVRKGIAANSRADAEQKMDDLTTDQLKACPPGPTPSGPPPDPEDYPSGGSSEPTSPGSVATLNGSESATPTVTPDPSDSTGESATTTPSPSPSNCRNP
jgi:protein phosphatase